MRRTWEANPGEVWEEQEFWIDLSWHIDPDGSLGIRRHFESSERPGEPLGIDEYYDELFRHQVPGLPEAAAAEGLSPLAYTKGTDFKPAARPDPETIIHWDTW